MGYVNGAIYKSTDGNYVRLGSSFPEEMSVTSYIRWIEMGSESCCGWKAQDRLRSRCVESYEEKTAWSVTGSWWAKDKESSWRNLNPHHLQVLAVRQAKIGGFGKKTVKSHLSRLCNEKHLHYEFVGFKWEDIIHILTHILDVAQVQSPAVCDHGRKRRHLWQKSHQGQPFSWLQGQDRGPNTCSICELPLSLFFFPRVKLKLGYDRRTFSSDLHS